MTAGKTIAIGHTPTRIPVLYVAFRPRRSRDPWYCRRMTTDFGPDRAMTASWVPLALFLAVAGRACVGPSPSPQSGCAPWCAGHQGNWPMKCKWTACNQCPNCNVPPPSPPRPINGSTVTVLVFGDSWGSLGPSWRELQDMFDRHGVDAVVRSAAVGGTAACQWAMKGSRGPGSALADAAAQLFPCVCAIIELLISPVTCVRVRVRLCVCMGAHACL